MAKLKSPDTMDFFLANVCHLHRIRHDQLLDSLGLHQGQPRVLFVLWEQEGLSQTELLERLQVTPATLTKMLQRMEKSGFVARRSDPLDQRLSRVYLTDAGRAVKDQVEAVWRTLEAETYANFTPDEKMLLRRFLLQIRDNLAKCTGEEPWQ